MRLQIGIFGQADILAMSDKVKSELQRYGVQLFSCDPSVGIRPEGSGVFVEYRQELFLFTVAHVLAAFKERDLWIPLNDRFVRIERPMLGTLTGKPEDGDHYYDPMDAAVLPIPPMLASNYEGVPIEDADAIVQPSDPDETAYVLIGYPEHHTEVDDENKEVSRTCEPLVFAEVDPIIYSQHGVETLKRLLLKRQEKTLLNFASGGAIWQLTLRGTIRTPGARLVATFVDAGDYFASGARIALHLELVRRNIAARQESARTERHHVNACS